MLQLTKAISLNKYEEELAYGALHPEEISIGFADVGGNESAIIRLQQITSILLHSPPTADGPAKAMGRLLRPPSGVLLYGPPGCGKTLIARALARESGVRFLSLNLATVLDKWVGETEKYIAALFSLASKIRPVIIFIDEIDALTRRRTAQERDWSSGMKSQLLTFWDGVGRDALGGVMVLGATNRPQDIDEAFLRRMPVQIRIDLPGPREREQIIRIFLQDLGLFGLEADIPELAALSEGFSGSDLQELARRAALKSTLEQCELDQAILLKELELLRCEKASCRLFA